MIVWRDGSFLDADKAVSAADRGYLVGDAVFETMLVDRGRAAFLEAHLARLRRGLAAINIRAPVDAAELCDAVSGLARRNGVEGRAACRLTVSRTGGRRGLAPSPDARSQILISIAPAVSPPAVMRIVVSDRVRWSVASTNGFKCVGAYAENLLARMEAAARGAGEAIMLNEHGRVACASAANVLIATPDGFATPPLSEGAMPGIVRGVALEEARRLGIAWREEPVKAAALRSGTVLLTNSLIGVVQTVLDGSDVADRPHARDLVAAYESRLAQEFAS